MKVDGKETMTVAELRDALGKYAQDLPVFATWEGVWASFKQENFKCERYSGEASPLCIVIDVEDYNS